MRIPQPGLASSDAWPRRYADVRASTEALTKHLSAEDCQIQSMPDVSPAKWHLAHTSWFFETFLLVPLMRDYRVFDPAYAVLFNSYYVAVGERHPRPQRGLLSRPTLQQIHEYRWHVDRGIARLMEQVPVTLWRDLLELGLNHEQQHQELILMDIQHVFSCNPLEPAYRRTAPPSEEARTDRWLSLPGRLYAIGHEGEGFAFDNEGPRHRVWLEPFEIANRLATAGDYLEFIEDGGYRRPELWLSDGWAMAAAEGWVAPLYWRRQDGAWTRFTLEGRRPVDSSEPVLHVSHYEADAYARWAGARLPTEAAWEVAAEHTRLPQVFGDGWQWTASPYVAYAGFSPAAGGVGEYNGKFMVNQMVLRGGSLGTPPGHTRTTYRNFFPSSARWPFTALRLARSWGAPAGFDLTSDEAATVTPSNT